MFVNKANTKMMRYQTPIAYVVTMLFVSCASSSSFSRDLSMDNRNIADELAEVQTSLTIDECARECHGNASCASFLHNQDGGRCHLRSLVYIHTDTVLEEGSRTFVKNSVCRIPEVINKGRVLYTDGLAEGSRAEFVCDDYYFPASVAGVCNTSGSWVGLNPACHQDKGNVAAEGKVFPGACVVVMGTPTNETQFVIRLVGPPPIPENINLWMSARFNWDSDIRQIVFRSSIGNHWSTHDRGSTIWPFVVNQEFNLTFCTEEILYRIFVDGVEIHTYDFHGLSPEDVVRINASNDVILRSVRFIGATR